MKRFFIIFSTFICLGMIFEIDVNAQVVEQTFDCNQRFMFNKASKTILVNVDKDSNGCNFVPLPRQGVDITDGPVGTVPGSPWNDLCYIDPNTGNWTKCRNAFTEPIFLGRLFDALKNQLKAKVTRTHPKANQNLLNKAAVEEIYIEAGYFMWNQQDWVKIYNNPAEKKKIVDDFKNYYSFVSQSKWVYAVAITGEVLNGLCTFSGAGPNCDKNAQGAAFVDLTHEMVAAAKGAVTYDEQRFINLQNVGHNNLGIAAMKTNDANLMKVFNFIGINTFPGPTFVEWQGTDFLKNFQAKTKMLAYFDEIGADSYIGWINQKDLTVAAEGYEDYGVQAFILGKQCELIKKAMDDPQSPIINGPQFFVNQVDNYGWSALSGKGVQTAWVQDAGSVLINNFPWQISGPDQVGALEYMGLFEIQHDANNIYAPNTLKAKQETVDAINNCWAKW